jgi:hypothetical protein
MRVPGCTRSRGAVAVLALVLAACGPTASPSPSPSPSLRPTPSPVGSVDPAAVYGAIAGQVEQIRGLRPKADVTPVLLDEATLRQDLAAEFDHDNPPAAVQASQAILTTLGLLEPGTSLRDANLDLLSGQAIGFYSPDRDALFLVSRSGGIGPTQRATYAHEFTHQLQDQNFDLARLHLDAPDQGDRSLARLALVEGDAVATQAAWMQANLTPQDLGQVLADAADPVASAALARAPAVLRASLLFPYTDGYAFVTGLLATGGFAAVDAAFGRPPDSTEQVLHPDKYRAAEPPDPVTLPKTLAATLGRGWAVTAQDTLGELMLRTWLTESGVSGTTAATAAAGWGGDRLALLVGSHGELAMAIMTRWDSLADADEFAHAAASAVDHVRGVARVVTNPGSPTVVIAIAPSESILGKLALAVSG